MNCIVDWEGNEGNAGVYIPERANWATVTTVTKEPRFRCVTDTKDKIGE